jgi:hypothetical protein
MLAWCCLLLVVVVDQPGCASYLVGCGDEAGCCFEQPVGDGFACCLVHGHHLLAWGVAPVTLLFLG